MGRILLQRLATGATGVKQARYRRGHTALYAYAQYNIHLQNNHSLLAPDSNDSVRSEKELSSIEDSRSDPNSIPHSYNRISTIRHRSVSRNKSISAKRKTSTSIPSFLSVGECSICIMYVCMYASVCMLFVVSFISIRHFPF